MHSKTWMENLQNSNSENFSYGGPFIQRARVGINAVQIQKHVLQKNKYHENT